MAIMLTRAALASCILAVSAGAADANQCPAYQQHLPTSGLQLGCPLDLLDNATPGNTPQLPEIRKRLAGGTEVLVASTATHQDLTLPVDFIHYSGPTCAASTETVATLFHQTSLTLVGVAVGDELLISGTTYVVAPAGPCAPVTYDAAQLYCQDGVGECTPVGSGSDHLPADPGGGCAAGGEGSWLAALALVGALAARRRG
jgi:MYXO-CTERM domain-containing protein